MTLHCPSAHPQRRLQQGNGQHAFSLCEQYRMAPRIREWPNDVFYDGVIRDAPAIANRQGPKALDGCVLFPYSFVNVDGTERQEGTSFCNGAEAWRVRQLLEFLHRRGMKVVGETAQVGVITGYAAQVTCIQNELETSVVKGADVKTVDGFQGSERDVIIVSIVRANPECRVGFWEQERRLNVALTRARFGLVVLGHKHTMARSRSVHFSKLLEDAYRHHCTCSERDFEDAIGLSHPDAVPPQDRKNFPPLAHGAPPSGMPVSMGAGSQDGEARPCIQSRQDCQSRLMDFVLQTLEKQGGSIPVEEFVEQLKLVAKLDIAQLWLGCKGDRQTIFYATPPTGNSSTARESQAWCNKLALLFHKYVEVRGTKFMTKDYGDSVRDKRLNQRNYLMCKVRTRSTL